MSEFEYRPPVIPQFNFKKISSNSCQMPESKSLSCYDLGSPHRSTQEYKQILYLADHGCGYPKVPDVLKFVLGVTLGYNIKIINNADNFHCPLAFWAY